MNIVNVGYRSTNYYVLATHRPLLLIDAGWPGTLPQMLGQCRRMDIEIAAIPYILVTHYHPDHAGLTQELMRLGPRLLVLDVQRAAIPGLVAYARPDQPIVPIDPDDGIALAIADSRRFLARLGIAGEIVATPGHSDDSVSLVLDDGATFTGDLTSPLLAPDDPDDAIFQSWSALRAHGATTIYPGHGPSMPLRWPLGAQA